MDHEKIYAIVNQIPKGSVATYGQIARLAGYPRHARQVGYALGALKKNAVKGVAWHRVVNAKGEISMRADGGSEEFQRIILEDEGIEFSLHGRIPLKTYQWAA